MISNYSKFDSLESHCSDFISSLAPGQLLETLFDAIPGAFYFVKDLESRFVTGSESFAHNLGASSFGCLIGRTDYDFSPDFLADEFFADDQKVMRTGVPIHDKVELVPSSDGSLDWLCTTKIPLHKLDGTIIGLAGVSRIIQDTDSVYSGHPEMHLIVNYMRAHYRDKVSVGDIAAVGGVSVSTQERLFKKTFGLTPLVYLQKIRLNAACKLLRDAETSLAQIAVECGFKNQTSMTRVFRLELRTTPLKYRKRFTNTPAARKKASPSLVLLPQS